MEDGAADANSLASRTLSRSAQSSKVLSRVSSKLLKNKKQMYDDDKDETGVKDIIPKNLQERSVLLQKLLKRRNIEPAIGLFKTNPISVSMTQLPQNLLPPMPDGQTSKYLESMKQLHLSGTTSSQVFDVFMQLLKQSNAKHVLPEYL